jgi:hypothetical protein
MLLRPEHRWECPNCDFTDVTHEAEPHSRFHPCAGLAGLTAPMVPTGTKCKVVAHEREDYIGGEDVRLVEGRPVMSVEVVRDDGTDLAVYAATATGRGEG